MKQATNNKIPKKSLVSLAPERKRERQKAVWTEVSEVARQHFKKFVSLEPKVLQGDDTAAIHDFRVASRRLQQVLDLLYPKPRPKKIRKLRRTVQRCRQVFSTVRNCDVLIDRVNGCLARSRTSQPEAWIALKQYLETRRSDAFQRAVRKLSGFNLSHSYVQLQGFMDGPPDTVIDAGTSGPDPADSGKGTEVGTLDGRLWRELGLKWEEFEAHISRSQNEHAPEALHAVRIAVKRLRYLIEVIDELGLRKTKKPLLLLRHLQRDLGDWHDLEVLEQMMAEMIARPQFLRSNIDLAIKIERLMLKNQKSKALDDQRLLYSRTIIRCRSELQAWVSESVSNSAPLDLRI